MKVWQNEGLSVGQLFLRDHKWRNVKWRISGNYYLEKQSNYGLVQAGCDRKFNFIVTFLMNNAFQKFKINFLTFIEPTDEFNSQNCSALAALQDKSKYWGAHAL